MFSKELIKRLDAWAGVIGVLTILFGFFCMIGGLFANVMLAILPGLFFSWSGFKIYNIKSHTSEIMTYNTENSHIQVSRVLEEIVKYLRIHAIVILILTILAFKALLQ